MNKIKSIKCRVIGDFDESILEPENLIIEEVKDIVLLLPPEKVDKFVSAILFKKAKKITNGKMLKTD